MNSSTITSMFGINPNNFKPTDINPICSDVGFVYYLEQSTDKIPCPFCNSSNNVTIKGYYFKNINNSCNTNMISRGDFVKSCSSIKTINN